MDLELLSLAKLIGLSDLLPLESQGKGIFKKDAQFLNLKTGWLVMPSAET